MLLTAIALTHTVHAANEKLRDTAKQYILQHFIAIKHDPVDQIDTIARTN
jgi:hypothetical protein